MAQVTDGVVPSDDSDIHDEPHIEGRRITVRGIVERVEGAGIDAETVADQYDLALADVYRALTY